MLHSDTFGWLLRSFRLRLGGARHTIEWLANQLAYPLSTIYGWENGDLSKGLPTRAVILSIARLYDLKPDEANVLIIACRSQRKRSAEVSRYPELSPDEVSAWMPLQGPDTLTLDILRDRMCLSQGAYLAGELRSSRSLAESTLRSIEASEVVDGGATLWRSGERDELDRLWMVAWRQFFEASALLEDGEAIDAVCRPYLVRSRHRARGVNDARVMALALHLEGDYHHLRGAHAVAMGFHVQAYQRLGSFDADPVLAAMIHRLIILDGAHLASPAELAHHVRHGRALMERLPSEAYQARILLCEAVGRALGMIGDRDCWDILAAAESDALGRFPVGYVTALYSRLVALSSLSREADVEQMRHVGEYALIVATHGGWKRRSEQIVMTAGTRGVALRTVPTPVTHQSSRGTVDSGRDSLTA